MDHHLLNCVAHACFHQRCKTPPFFSVSKKTAGYSHDREEALDRTGRLYLGYCTRAAGLLFYGFSGNSLSGWASHEKLAGATGQHPQEGRELDAAHPSESPPRSAPFFSFHGSARTSQCPPSQSLGGSSVSSWLQLQGADRLAPSCPSQQTGSQCPVPSPLNPLLKARWPSPWPGITLACISSLLFSSLVKLSPRHPNR